MDRSSLADLYRSESRDQIAALGRAVLAIERSSGDREAIDEAFRAAHTIKGMSAAMGYDSVAGLAHGVEHLLDRLRQGLVAADGDLIDLLLAAVDQLEKSTEGIPGGREGQGIASVDTGLAGGSPDGSEGGAERLAPTAGSRYVRVDERRIDVLVDRASELLVGRHRLLDAMNGAAGGDADVRTLVEALGVSITRLRDEVLGLRLAPIGEVFDRLDRLVRDTARRLGKEVELEARGADVELDRALIGDLADLLTHLLRNAIDHGVEPPAERAAVGKRRTGRVRVVAKSDQDSVLVRVEDDGRGIDAEAVRRRAVTLGLRGDAAPAQFGPDELIDLLTRPGFSTAGGITEVSGRGVGLDRVASRLRELGGDLSIESVAGAGAVFTLRIPKTLSLTRVLVVECGCELLGIPSTGVDRVVDRTLSVAGDGASEDEDVRASVDLVDLLGLPPTEADGSDGYSVVISGSGSRVALEVVAVRGLLDVIVKEFAVPRGVADVFVGAAILPDGRPMLVVQPALLIRHLSRRGLQVEAATRA